MRGAPAGRGAGDVLYFRANPGETFVKLVLFQPADDVEARPGLLTDRGVVDISGAVTKGHTPQLTMQGIIDGYDALKPVLEKFAATGPASALDKVQLKAPLPRP